MSYKKGDKFWLLFSPINPILVEVEVLEVTPEGDYLVDEPCGPIVNKNCVFATLEQGIKLLDSLKAEGSLIFTSEFSTNLEGQRRFFREAAIQQKKPEIWTTPTRPKTKNKEWINYT